MGQKPAYNAFAVQGEGDQAFWTRIGAAWNTRGEGLNIVLTALPLDGRIVLRVPKDGEDSPPTNNGSSQQRQRR